MSESARQTDAHSLSSSLLLRCSFFPLTSPLMLQLHRSSQRVRSSLHSSQPCSLSVGRWPTHTPCSSDRGRSLAAFPRARNAVGALRRCHHRWRCVHFLHLVCVLVFLTRRARSRWLRRCHQGRTARSQSRSTLLNTNFVPC